ncbi:MAG TPA: SCO family protein [Burkholderiales bacterium]|nr:SCO family protein [Burkholderiales bacterium]
MAALNGHRAILGIVSCVMLVATNANAHETDRAVAIDADAAIAASQRVIGKPIGHHTLTDTTHRNVALSDYRGAPVVVNFVYTGCSQICPTATRSLAKAVREAHTAFGPDKFRIVSIGFNQPFDTPDAMAAFARQNGIRDADWSFLGADAGDVAALARDFGFTYKATAKGIDHLSQVTIVDRDGIVYRQIYGDAFEPRMLLAPLKELLSGQAQQAGFSGVWDKVKLFCTVYDPNTGGYRVNYSLFIEIFAGASILVGIAWFLLAERRRYRR